MATQIHFQLFHFPPFLIHFTLFILLRFLLFFLYFVFLSISHQALNVVQPHPPRSLLPHFPPSLSLYASSCYETVVDCFWLVYAEEACLHAVTIHFSYDPKPPKSTYLIFSAFRSKPLSFRTSHLYYCTFFPLVSSSTQ